MSGGAAGTRLQQHGWLKVLDIPRFSQDFVDDLQDQPRPACRAQLRVNPLQMGVDCVHGDAEFVGNGTIRCVLENEPHDLKFTPREFQAIGNTQPLALAE